mmetsp:Transcript_9948/g.12406  ORF Transcript_9948/g.12406 Transcript_9948/m.12406 type:complete len:223 (-) Transcript_9948:910-1578(-)
MREVAREKVAGEPLLCQEAALDTLSLSLLRVLPVLEQMEGLASRNGFVHLLKLDKSGAEALRPLVVPLVLQRVQLVVVCLICTVLTRLQSGLAPLALLDKLGVGKSLLLLLFCLFLGFQQIFLLVLLGTVDKDGSGDFDGEYGTVFARLVPHIAKQILEIVQVLRVLKPCDVVNPQETRRQGELEVFLDFEFFHGLDQVSLLFLFFGARDGSLSFGLLLARG